MKKKQIERSNFELSCGNRLRGSRRRKKRAQARDRQEFEIHLKNGLCRNNIAKSSKRRHKELNPCLDGSKGAITQATGIHETFPRLRNEQDEGFENFFASAC